MTDNQQNERSWVPCTIPMIALVLSMLLWASLWLRDAVPDMLVRILLLATPLAAIGPLLQPLGLFLNEPVPLEQRTRLVVMDVVSLVVVVAVLAGGSLLFPEKFQWIRCPLP